MGLTINQQNRVDKVEGKVVENMQNKTEWKRNWNKEQKAM